MLRNSGRAMRESKALIFFCHPSSQRNVTAKRTPKETQALYNASRKRRHTPPPHATAQREGNAGALQRNLKETQAQPATPRHGTTPQKRRRITAHLHRNAVTAPQPRAQQPLQKPG